jgi:hypothetical protein
MDIRTIHSADVVVTFTGLLLLRFGPQRKFCQIGAHPSPSHRLRIAVELWKRANKKKQNSDELIERWEHSGKLTDHLYINIIKPEAPGLSSFYYHESLFRGDLESKSRLSDLPPEVKSDIRWAVNFQDFHLKDQLSVIAKEVFEHSIFVNHGLLHTAQLYLKGDPDFPLSLRRNSEFLLDTDQPPFEADLKRIGLVLNDKFRSKNVLSARSVAEIIGIAIRLKAAGGKLRFQWGAQSRLFPFSYLEKPKPGYFYKIVFNNDCRQEKDCTPLTQVSSDLPFYYVQRFQDGQELKELNILPRVPKDKQLDFTRDLQGIGPDFPCMPIFISMD